MSLRFKTNLLEHLKAAGRWARQHGVLAQVRADDGALLLQRGAHALVLPAQFVGRRDGQHLSYFAEPDEHARGFVGWLPYRPLAWPISTSKLRFKRLAQSLGLRVPQTWPSPAEADAPFLVKCDRGAFGHGMHGPYRPRLADGTVPQTLQQGEFCEAFHHGQIARAWYWSGVLAVLEQMPMPQVQGNGRDTLAALLMQASPEPLDDLAAARALAALQGLDLAAVPAPGQPVLADYRYVSPLNPTLYANHNLLRQPHPPAALRAAFARAGAALWPHVPGAWGPAGRQAAFVLDAIVGDDGVPVFLEINSNAQGHPDLYAPMLDALTAPWGAAAGDERVATAAAPAALENSP
jgi:hypothetical protein